MSRWPLPLSAGLLVLVAWLQLPWSLVVLGLATVVLIVTRNPGSSTLRWGAVGFAACGFLLGGLAWTWAGPRTAEAVAARAARALSAMKSQAERVAGSAQLLEIGRDSGSAAFARLESIRRTERGPGSTVVLVDEDGVAEAWAGGGLRHPLPESELPNRGWLILESFTASTVSWIEPLGDGSGRRVVVGLSESALELPTEWGPSCLLQRQCAAEASSVQTGRVWRLGLGREDGSESLTGSRVSDAGAYRLVADDFTLSLRESEARRLSGRIGIHVLIPLLMLVLMIVECGVDLAARWPGGDRSARRFLEPLWIALCAVGAALGAGAITPVEATLLGSQLVVLCALAVGVTWARQRSETTSAWFLVTLCFGFAVTSAWWALALARDETLAQPGAVALPSVVLFVSMVLSHLGLGLGFAITVDRGSALRAGRWTALGAGLFLGVVAAHVAIALFGVLVATLAIPRPRRAGGTALLWILVLSGAANGMVWVLLQERETTSRMLRSVIADDSPFAGPGRWRVDSRLERHFDSIDISVAALGLEAGGGWADDLALFLWATSPLSELEGPSAVRVREGTRTAFFGFGLQQDSNDAEPFLEQSNTPVRRNWIRDALVKGRSELASGGDGPLEVEWFALPLPSGPRERARSLAYRFLLGEPAIRKSWFPNAELRLGPWEGQSMVELGGLPDARLQQNAGAGSRSGPATDSKAGLAIRLGRVQSIERWFEESFVLARLSWRRDGALGLMLRAVRMASSTLLILLAGATTTAFLLLLARRRSWSIALGPFSRRLMLVFSVFTVVPIVLLTVILLQSFSGRLRANQQEAGERALQSAERMLGDYISSLEPGFSVTAALDADLLSWVSSIVRHEVNLYWRGAVLTASRPEIFAAGVLPNQIPGAIYASLEDHRNEVAARRNQTATETEYLELYREVEFPGVARSDLFVSVPLLAQEAETALTQRRMLAQALALATGLALLLVFVASRFASAFTEPIRAIVGGTVRIAQGDDELGLQPSIPELRELAQAIDDMAGTIAAGRERLVREKRVVDTVIANIKSAVVSFGREDRVIMVNRQAADLLRVRPGDSLEDVAGMLESKDWKSLIERRPRVPERISIRIGEPGFESAAAGEWTVQWLPIAGEGDPAALLVLEDVTEVLRAQRLEAWAEMARIIAHEVKNPLTPIRLSADHLRRVYENSPERIGEVFDRCVDNILAQVEELRLIAGEFSIYSRIPTADRRALDLVDTVKQVTESYRVASTEDLEFPVRLPDGPLICVHDPRLIGRVLRNLYENSIRACGGSGRVALRFDVVEGGSRSEKNLVDHWARIRVTDTGPGVAPKDLDRIFEPSFSASSGGTGLGLPISRGIIEEHGGEITAANRVDDHAASDGMTGLEMSILLPLADRV